MAHGQEDEYGWTVDPSEFANLADRRRGHQRVQASGDADGISIDIDEGSGYMSQSVSTFIPTPVVIALLERMGYVVTRKPV